MNKDKFIVEGLSGRRTLKGSIRVKGSKNAALPVMASSILFEDTLTLTNVPAIEDVFRMSELLTGLGFQIIQNGDELKISPSKIGTSVLDTDLSKMMRASIFLIGPLLGRLGKVSFPHPGGCVIGERPIDLFLNGFASMGVSIEEERDRYILTASNGKLKGAEIFFPIQSVGATETFIMSAVLASGKTILKNVALEPEVISLGEHLISCGAKIKGLGTTTIEIDGGELLRAGDKKYTTIPDRLETGSFLIMGALASDDLVIENCNPGHIEILIQMLEKSGVKIETEKNSIKIKGLRSGDNPKSFNIKTHEYPGFPTDIQAPVVVFLTQAMGESVVFETIFDNRLNFTADLVRMGAQITMWDPHRVSIKGPTILHSKELEGPDIRAGLAFIIAATVAKGTSVINNAYYIDRGYEKIENRLREIGLNIKRE